MLLTTNLSNLDLHGNFNIYFYNNLGELEQNRENIIIENSNEVELFKNCLYFKTNNLGVKLKQLVNLKEIPIIVLEKIDKHLISCKTNKKVYLYQHIKDYNNENEDCELDINEIQYIENRTDNSIEYIILRNEKYIYIINANYITACIQE